jgi:hypothetical protein
MSVATFERLRGSAARATRRLDQPAACAQDWCVFDFTSRFMNGFVKEDATALPNEKGRSAVKRTGPSTFVSAVV